MRLEEHNRIHDSILKKMSPSARKYASISARVSELVTQLEVVSILKEISEQSPSPETMSCMDNLQALMDEAGIEDPAELLVGMLEFIALVDTAFIVEEDEDDEEDATVAFLSEMFGDPYQPPPETKQRPSGVWTVKVTDMTKPAEPDPLGDIWPHDYWWRWSHTGFSPPPVHPFTKIQDRGIVNTSEDDTGASAQRRTNDDQAEADEGQGEDHQAS